MAREEAAAAMAGEEAVVASEGGGLLMEIVSSPLNLSLLGLCLFLLYQILRGERPAVPAGEEDPPPLPKMKRRDFTLAELRPYDGRNDPRILMAVNGKVFDVTRARKFYGPGEGRRGEPGSGAAWCGGLRCEARAGPRPWEGSSSASPHRAVILLFSPTLAVRAGSRSGVSSWCLHSIPNSYWTALYLK
ncbi:membrane-associated progesterone receptor component 1 isoform X2 [Oxyura jamaicensis]|uniref:membrane-associated progesterone receptor component 1 isoform X2 n=1 Tax=Oxyura jamaicensis TaxID=8884 RepID=UPI0015A5AF59|nr:membrane-associated progesterone receptor component 1 isoform X2 [Oxyura jamaicensis]